MNPPPVEPSKSLLPKGYASWEYLGMGKEGGIEAIKTSYDLVAACNAATEEFTTSNSLVGNIPGKHYWIARKSELTDARAGLLSVLSAKANSTPVKTKTTPAPKVPYSPKNLDEVTDLSELAMIFAVEVANVDVEATPKWRIDLYAKSFEAIASAVEPMGIVYGVARDRDDVNKPFSAQVEAKSGGLGQVIAFGATGSEALCRAFIGHVRAAKKQVVAKKKVVATITPPWEVHVEAMKTGFEANYKAMNDPFGFKEAVKAIHGQVKDGNKNYYEAKNEIETLKVLHTYGAVWGKKLPAL